jgi:O-antigen/teichoic acid export membrane protein
MARSYSPQEYGDFMLASSWLSALGAWALPGLSVVVISSVARKEGGTFRKAVKWQLTGSLGATICLIAVGWWQARVGVGLPFFAYVLAGVFSPFYLVDLGWHALMARRLYRKSAMLQIVKKGGSLLLLVAAILLRLPIAWFFAAGLVWVSLLNLWLMRSQWGAVGPETECDTAGFRYGLNLTLSNILLQPLSQLERLLVGLFLGTADLAVFGIGEMIYGYLKIPGSYVQNLYLPRISGMPVEAVGRYLVRHAVVWTAGFLALGIALQLLIPVVYPMLFGQAYARSAVFAGFYSIIFALGVPNYFLTLYFRHAQATSETYLYGLVRAPLQLGFIILGFSAMGMVGLPLARLFTNVVHEGIGFGMARRHSGAA